MKISRNLIRGAMALAFILPLGLIAALEGPTLFAGAATPAFPVACKLSGTVTFTPALTLQGVVSGDATAVTTTTITGGTLSSCLSPSGQGAPSSGSLPTLTITTPATKLIGVKVNKVQQYATGYCPAFASTATFKSLKGLVMNVTWTGGEGGTSTFTNHAASPAISLTTGEVGFVFLGKQGAGSYSQKALNQVTAYLDASVSTALSTGCGANQTVSGATIDPNTSVAIL